MKELVNLESNLRQAISDKVPRNEWGTFAKKVGMQATPFRYFMEGHKGLNSKTIEKIAKEL